MAGFQDIVGHRQVIAHLQNAMEKDRISHAYIIHGEHGAGKSLLAATFAMTLQCEKGGKEPCGQCHSCKQAMTRNQPDIIYVQHEKPNTISVDDIRKQVNGDIEIKPYSSKYKIYIIDEADKMNQQAQNALLKTIEEPPAYAVVLLLVANISALLPTILSRCVTLKLGTVEDSLIREFLMKNLGVPDYTANICAAFAGGYLGKAVELASNEDFNNMKRDILSILKEITQIELSDMVQRVKALQEYKLRMDDFFDIMIMWFRDVLLFKATNDRNGIVFRDEAGAVVKQASLSGYDGIQRIIEALEKAKARLKANVSFELTLELLLLTIKENS